MADKWVEAEQDYLAGMKYKDIAAKYDVALSTVKSWKQRYGWSRNKDAPPKKSTRTKSKSTRTKNIVEEAIDEVDDSVLTDKQKAFVIEYVRSFNATQSYMNVYGVDYKTASAAGPRLLGNVRVKREIERVRKARLQEMGADKNDVLADLMKQAFSDIGSYLDFGGYDEFAIDYQGEPLVDVDGNPVINHRSWVQLKDKSLVDTSLIKKVSIGRDGVVLDLYDKQKAQERLLAEINKSQQVELESARVRRVIADAIIAEAKAAAIQTTGAEQERQDEQIDRLLAGINIIAQEELRKADEGNG